MAVCPYCGNEYDRVNQHISMSSECSHDEFTDDERELITAILIGDGWIASDNSGNPSLQIEMITEDYIQELDEKLGWISNGYEKIRTAEESFERTGDTFNQTNAENYNSVYRLSTIRSKQFNYWLDWYEGGKKNWIDKVELTPTILTHYYVADGHLRKDRNCIKIAMSEQLGNEESVSELFRDAGLPSPDRYDKSERSGGSVKFDAIWNVDSTKELLDYMNEAPDGFEYKFQ